METMLNIENESAYRLILDCPLHYIWKTEGFKELVETNELVCVSSETAKRYTPPHLKYFTGVGWHTYRTYTQKIKDKSYSREAKMQILKECFENINKYYTVPRTNLDMLYDAFTYIQLLQNGEEDIQEPFYTAIDLAMLNAMSLYGEWNYISYKPLGWAEDTKEEIKFYYEDTIEYPRSYLEQKLNQLVSIYRLVLITDCELAPTDIKHITNTIDINKEIEAIFNTGKSLSGLEYTSWFIDRTALFKYRQEELPKLLAAEVLNTTVDKVFWLQGVTNV